MAHKEIDRVSGVETTGHEWDGLKELNHPLPKWWLYVWYACIAWALVYYVLYPSWPLVTGYTTGVLGYSQREAALTEVRDGQAARLANAAGLGDASFEKILADPKLLDFAKAQGRAAFGDNCAPCHGSNGVGAPGYPSLQDDDWLWGGKIEDIHQTILVGIRGASPDSRLSAMPAFGKDGLLKKEEIADVADYVLSLSGRAPAGAKLDQGKVLYNDNCAACHGETGAGNAEVGGPNLTDAIWLYGSSRDQVIAQISNPKAGVMPTWSGRLDPITIKSLAVYVHGLSGGK